MKKTVAAILIICLLLGLAMPASAATLCFVAVNDTLLELSAAPYSSGGTTYLPYYVYSYLGVYFNYFPDVSMATLYMDSRQIYFDLVNGNTYDSAGNYYSGSATSYNGTVYVPMSTVDAFFGFGSAYIRGDGYGDVLRITNGAEVLGDDMFLNAAEALMRSRYNAYYSSTTPEIPGDPPGEDAPPEPPQEEAVAYLAFAGLPSAALLEAMDGLGLSACFFITAEEAAEDPALLRRIVCSGHSLGVWCAGEDLRGEYDRGQELIFRACLCQTVLVACPEQASAEEEGLALYAPEVYPTGERASDILRSIYAGGDGARILLDMDDIPEDALIAALTTLTQRSYTLLPVSETAR